jgi:Zn-finger protein
MEGALINCGRCGNLTNEILVAGKKTKNCKDCRIIHNNRNKTILKCENSPIGGFYKQEQVNILKDLEQEDEQEEDPYINKLEDEEVVVKEPTIKELLQDINNKLTNNTPENKGLGEELTTILYSIVEKLENNKLDNFIKEQHLKNRIIINKLDALINAIA